MISFIKIKEGTSHVEVLTCDDKYLYGLEVSEGFAYDFNDYYDKDFLVKFNDKDEYDIDEFFLYKDVLFLVDSYSYHSGSIYAREVLRAVIIPKPKVEFVHAYANYYIQYIKKEDLLSNVQ